MITIGETIQCGHCNFAKYGEGLKSLPLDYACDCICHDRKFNLGDRVRKIKGSAWSGFIVGFYSTDLTPEGYAVESEVHTGSVQIYPASALEPF